jgi:hypothetical protein
MQSTDDGVIVNGHQHFYHWGQRRKVYEILVRIKKAAKSSELSEQMVDVPDCPALSIN